MLNSHLTFSCLFHSYVTWQLAGTSPFPQMSSNRPQILDLNCCGIVIDDNDEDSAKHSSPISLTEDGIDIDDNDEHPPKQQSPMTLTEDGIDIDDNDEHPLKHQSP